ncbi:MAG: sigma-54-dependent Fis family transcriptional regulator [Gammaproteobacteria bacterium]|nr:sigma-54-dependent Fis family transcriptional regulator [Gammaproteobacteria bacterium]
MSRQKILIVEDEIVIRTSLKKFLEKQSFLIEEAESLKAALRFNLQDFALIITDLRLPGPSGTDIIKEAMEVPVLVMTSYASVTSAVDAMKLGAADYVAKPFDYQDLLSKVKTLVEEKSHPAIIEGMLGSCEAILDLMRRIHKVAPTGTNVLIQGESGTGKELVAKAIHKASHQSGHNMISLNCAAIPDTLIESELFGHEKGAFTGATNARVGLIEAADGGTLFLDEIGELPLEAQARLLRVLQEGEVRRVGSVATKKVSVRLIAATHRNLKELTQRGGFREDLYYRLNVVKLILPPLRDRNDDITTLADHFLKLNCDQLGKPCLSFSPSAQNVIQSYRWPGNIRELENAIERAVILCEGKTISPDLLSVDSESGQETLLKSTLANNIEKPLVDNEDNLSIEDYFQKFVLEHQDSMTETELAQQLGISRKSLWQRRQKLNLPRERSRKL